MTENINIDIIILNEMDIGMTRTNNVHTTLLLAESLNMTFAFGLEFIEFTMRTQEEQKILEMNENTKDVDNKYGIHGSAILCKCIFNENSHTSKIIRSKIDDMYFSNKDLWINAHA